MSKERLAIARKAISDVKTSCNLSSHSAKRKKSHGDEIASVRRKMDELNAKADKAERWYDLTIASYLRYYALPDLQRRLM